MSRGTTALVVGKFAPLHVGHQFLIETAMRTADRVVVLCSSNPDFTFADSATRASWIRELYPEVTTVVPVEAPANDSPDAVHQDFTSVLLTKRRISIDYVITGEDYGDSLAKRLSAKHIRIERLSAEHKGIPRSISGTNIRADVFASLEHLDPLVRDYVEKRVNHAGTLE